MNLSKQTVQRRTIVSRILFALLILIVTYLALDDLSYPPTFSISDKLNHLIAFLVLAGLLDYSIPNTHFNGKKFIFLLSYGALLEVIQYFLPYRTFSIWDFAVDAIGVILYTICTPLLAKLPLLQRPSYENSDR